MLNRTVKEKMLKIMELGFEVNRKEKNTVFIRFSGHCELFEVSIHSKGWKNGVGADFFKDMFLARLSQRETEEKLDEIIEELERLKIN
ncbi:hypothetical protein RO03_05880 [Fusobacterium nucleatum subsp. nucleatum]|jgi:hypothetical protein|uniref:Uncharacterized protein n=1 Tax=Fusobacterium nucleatum subsp. nucleatum TaxID=76856 RepID=A0A0X3Y217_FUSNC|nr:hypothetical protein [Fusobacterium nucleatum]KUL99057.1 hypothetical protein RO03_05880 [Fusobacterium nucleatum subsp. nucleatum]